VSAFRLPSPKINTIFVVGMKDNVEIITRMHGGCKFNQKWFLVVKSHDSCAKMKLLGLVVVVVVAVKKTYFNPN
jgi:hypothetical protein